MANTLHDERDEEGVEARQVVRSDDRRSLFGNVLASLRADPIDQALKGLQDALDDPIQVSVLSHPSPMIENHQEFDGEPIPRVTAKG